MHVSKEIDYGLRAMIVIASNPEALLSSKEISKRFGIPYNFLSLILPKLVRRGLIQSLHGPKGGYKLARPASQIVLLEIIETLNGPIELISCNTKNNCEFDTFCSLVSVWQDLKTKIESHFSALTLDRFIMAKMQETSQ